MCPKLSQNSRVKESLPCIRCVQVGGGKSAEEMAAEVSTLLGGDMPDVTIECSGAEPSIR